MAKILVIIFSFCLLFGENNVSEFEKSSDSQVAFDVNLSQTGLKFGAEQNLTDIASNSQAPSIDLSFISLFKNAHIVVKIVICVLILFSVITWTIFIVKFIQFKLAFCRLKSDENTVEDASDWRILKLKKKSFAADFIRELEDESKKSVKFDKNMKLRVKQRLDLKKSSLANVMRGWVGVLASIGSSAPFIGLFGTVWGIMNSFVGIANSNNASLSVVAPGIAEALFATALGLVAAIPAVLVYNYLVRCSVKFNARLGLLSSQIYLIFDRLAAENE